MENFQIQNCLIKLNEKLDILHHAKLISNEIYYELIEIISPDEPHENLFEKDSIENYYVSFGPLTEIIKPLSWKKIYTALNDKDTGNYCDVDLSLIDIKILDEIRKKDIKFLKGLPGVGSKTLDILIKIIKEYNMNRLYRRDNI